MEKSLALPLEFYLTLTEQARTTQRHSSHIKGDEERLVARIIELATRYGRYGYRRITALLKQEGWEVNHKRVERIWRREGLKVLQKQPKRGRLWLTDGSCISPQAGIQEPCVEL